MGTTYPKSPFVFTSERGAPFTTAGFARMIERAGKPRWHLKHTLTCCVMRASTRLQTGATTRERSRHISAIAISSTRCDTLSCRRRGSRIFGGSEP